jgi:hypothetical protein
MPLLRLPTAMQTPVVQHTSLINMDELVDTVKSLFFRRCYKKCANHCVRLLKQHDEAVSGNHPIGFNVVRTIR